MMPWEQEAAERVDFLLANASFNTADGCVYFNSETDHGHTPSSNSMKELRQYLCDEYSTIFTAYAPCEAGVIQGDPLDTDDDVVNEALENYAAQLHAMGWQI